MRLYQHIFVVLYDFLRPTTGNAAFEATVAALSVIEATLVVGAQLIWPLTFGTWPVGASYRFAILALSFGLFAVNFLIFYSQRNVTAGLDRPNGVRRTAIVAFLLSPFLVWIAAMLIGAR